MSEGLPDLPDRVLPLAQHGRAPQEKERRRKVLQLLSSAGLLTVAAFCAPYAWELSDVKPNITGACILWLSIYICLAGVFWLWCKWKRMVKLLSVVLPAIAKAIPETTSIAS